MNRFGATILDAEGLTLSAAEKTFFRQANPYGFILFARNIDTPDQVRGLCAEMRACVGRDAPITIDQEGGRVQRLRAPHLADWMPPLDFVAAAGARAAEAMYLRYRLIAAELHDLGIDSNCAPMVDIAGPQTHDFLRNRCYGDHARNVSRPSVAPLPKGCSRAASCRCSSIFPAMGARASTATMTCPRWTRRTTPCRAHDFAPFKALNDLPMGMTAHLVYSSLDDRPATLSPKGDASDPRGDRLRQPDHDR